MGSCESHSSQRGSKVAPAIRNLTEAANYTVELQQSFKKQPNLNVLCPGGTDTAFFISINEHSLDIST